MKKIAIEFLLFIVFVLVYEGLKLWFSSSGNEVQIRYITKQPDEKQDAEFESYIFIDEMDVLHTNSHCEGLINASSYNEPSWKNILYISKYDIQKICSRCVTEEQSEILREIVKKKK